MIREDFVPCCEPTLLCDACYPTERVRLTREAERIGVALGQELVRSIVPEPRWVRALDEHSPIVTKRVEPLSGDPRLAPVLAKACLSALRRTLLEGSPST